MAENSTPGLSEAEKLASSGKKSHLIISRRTLFRADTKKKRYFILPKGAGVPVTIFCYVCCTNQ